MVTMSSYASRGMDVLSVKDMNWAQLSEYVTSKTGKVHYGTFDFITIGLRDLMIRLGFKSGWVFKYLPDGDGEVCSEMLADVLSKFQSVDTTMVSPARLYKEMFARGYVTNKLQAY